MIRDAMDNIFRTLLVQGIRTSRDQNFLGHHWLSVVTKRVRRVVTLSVG